MGRMRDLVTAANQSVNTPEDLSQMFIRMKTILEEHIERPHEIEEILYNIIPKAKKQIKTASENYQNSIPEIENLCSEKQGKCYVHSKTGYRKLLVEDVEDHVKQVLVYLEEFNTFLDEFKTWVENWELWKEGRESWILKFVQIINKLNNTISANKLLILTTTAEMAERE